MNALCAQAECSTFLDGRGVSHLDRETKKVVLLCEVCARQVAWTSPKRYERLEALTNDP